jgi:hypothetical protein
MEDMLSPDGQHITASNQLDVSASRTDLTSVENVFNQPPLSIPLSPESQTRMTRSIVDIFELEESPNNDVEMGEDGEEGPVVDVEDQRRRTDRLRGVLPTLGQLWWSDSDQIDLVAEKLGDGSRDRKLCPFQEYCSPLFNPLILYFLFLLLAENLNSC